MSPGYFVTQVLSTLIGIDPDARARVVPALDEINARFGLNTVYLGSIHNVRKEAPTRIPFGPPPPLEEFDDTADKERIERKGVRQAGIQKPRSGRRSA